MGSFFRKCGWKEYLFMSVLAAMFLGGIIGLNLMGPDPAMRPDRALDDQPLSP